MIKMNCKKNFLIKLKRVQIRETEKQKNIKNSC